MLGFEFNPKYDLYDENCLQEEYDEHCSHDNQVRIFFQGPVLHVDQKTTGAIYVLEEEESCRIKVANMTHVRLTDFPYPDTFDIIAPVIDRRLWGQKKVVRILDGLIPSSYLHLNAINYYLELRRRY